MTIDVAIPRDTRVCDKEPEKMEKFRFLRDETATWQIKM